MRLITVAEAAQYDLKEKVPALRGKITRVNDRRFGNTNGRAWSFQNLEIADLTDGNRRLRVKLWNRDEVPKAWTHKIVLIQSVEGERGPKGVSIEQDTYNWREGQPIKKQLEVQCEDGCSFELADDRSNPGPAPRQQASQPSQDGGRAQGAANQPARPTGNQRGANDPGWMDQNSGGGPAQQPPHGPGTKAAQDYQRQQQQPADPPAQKTAAEKVAEREAEYRKAIADTGKFCGRKVCGFAVVLAAMDKLQEQRQAMGKPLTADQFQGMCTSIFIAGDRSFQWDKLPTTLADLEKFWPEKKQPANTQQPAQ